MAWVKGTQAHEMHLPWVEMHLGWVDGPRAEEMRARWVQGNQEYLQPEGLLHVDHGL